MQVDYEKSWVIRPAICGRLVWILRALAGLGVVVFVASLRVEPTRGWMAYWVNFLFWSGLAQGAVIFAAIYHVVGAKWGANTRRLAEGMAAFLPVSFVLFFPLYFGLEIFFGRVRALNPNRGAWFDPRFVFVRGGLGIGLMTVLSLFFVYYSLRPEVSWARGHGPKLQSRIYRWMSEGTEEPSSEIQRSYRGLDVMGTGVLLAYPITYTFMAFDMIMALDPFWYSSLFGGYFFISTFYLGLAGLTVVAVLMRNHLGDSFITDSQLSDLGKLLLGFDLTYLAMDWAQYVVIWYGNLPEETHYLVLRMWQRPWAALSWSALTMIVLIPFLVFLSRRAKETPWIMISVGILIAAGLWIERYVLVVPSVWTGEGAPFGWIEIGITCGFLGAVGLSYLFFLRHFPVVPSVQGPLSSLSTEEVQKSPARA